MKGTNVELTEQQKANLEVYRQRWTEIGFSTHKPYTPEDKETIKRLIGETYVAAGLTPPKKFVWLASPLEGAYAACILENPSQRVTLPALQRVMELCGYGSLDAGYLGFYEYAEKELELEACLPLSSVIEVSKMIGLWWAAKDTVIITEKPIAIRVDENNRLHSTTAPAVEYSDGWGIYAIHAVRVNENIIKYPEKITIEEMMTERNAEVRRVMMERMPREKYEKAAVVLDRKIDGRGEERVLYRLDRGDLAPWVMVKVINATPERRLTGKKTEAFYKNGVEVMNKTECDYYRSLLTDRDELPEGVTVRIIEEMEDIMTEEGKPLYKEYWLRVPPTMTDANEAVAWTWNEDKDEYDPVVET